MDENTAQTQARKLPRWVKILLAVSLAANLLMIGAAVGAGFRAKSEMGGGGPRSGFAFVAALEHDDRRSIFKETRELRRATQQEARADMIEILTELRSDTFDLESFAARLSTQKAQAGAMQDTVSEALIAQVGEMTPTERAAYADRVQQHIEHRGKKRDGKKTKKDSKP